MPSTPSLELELGLLELGLPRPSMEPITFPYRADVLRIIPRTRVYHCITIFCSWLLCRNNYQAMLKILYYFVNHSLFTTVATPELKMSVRPYVRLSGLRKRDMLAPIPPQKKKSKTVLFLCNFLFCMSIYSINVLSVCQL